MAEQKTEMTMGHREEDLSAGMDRKGPTGPGKNVVEAEGAGKGNAEVKKALKEWQDRLAQKEVELNALQIKLVDGKKELEGQTKNIKNVLRMQLDKMKAGAAEEIAQQRAKAEEELRIQLEAMRDEAQQKHREREEQQEKELEEKREAAYMELASQIEKKRGEQKKRLEEERGQVQQELEEERKQAQQQLEEERRRTFAQLEKEHKRAMEQLEEETKAREKERKAEQKKSERIKSACEQLQQELEEKETELEDRQERLKAELSALSREKKRLDKEKQRIEDANEELEQMVAERFSDTVKNYEMQIKTKDAELDSLRTQLNALSKEQEMVKSFVAAYGEDPAVLKQTLTEQSTAIGQLRSKLANTSDKAEFERLQQENRELRERVSSLSEENSQLLEAQEDRPLLEAKYKTLEAQYRALSSTSEALENLLQKTQQELERLAAPEARLADREERIASLKKGILDDESDLAGAGLPNDLDEIHWLEGIKKKCSDYGISFHRRILYAFHTALKINEWSTITVLAGVSGTGKSELPRLYAIFGGLNFMNVAVQPGWDSQESMLGFFNSIDNRFEPEPLLRFLVQCTEDERYQDYMSIVLLDEMNLAYVEHYFAEFLSKLETRRGMAKKELPKVEVKLGAGVEPYELKLARTILWTGTMNQDETTKSLSDKVLDRGLIIHFPRPKTLADRNRMEIISKYVGDDRPKLHKQTWQSWTTHEIRFSEEQMEEISCYKKIVEGINDCMESAGRALGHRVWQSIEYYIANYPTVRKMQQEAGEKLTGELRMAMRTAFEDQIVQKIMPKLRGIEIRGKGRKILQEIEDLLVKEGFENLKDDFEMACEQGYGQFMWCSAKYLGEESDTEQTSTE